MPRGDPYRDDAEALRAKNQTLEAELHAEQKARQAAEAAATATRAARDEVRLRLLRLGQQGGAAPSRWYNSGAWAAGCLALSAVVAMMALRPSLLERAVAVALPVKPRPPKVPVQLYLMSKCPFGVKALNGLLAASRELPGRVDLSLEYIADERDGKITCLHGEKEAVGNKLHLCAREGYDRPKALSLIGCFNKSWRKLPDGWQACAREIVGATDRLRACIQGPEGERLLRASARRSNRAGAKGSPTIMINGQSYNGGRTVNDFVRALCAQMRGEQQPLACAALPVEPVVHATVLTDGRCGKQCDTSAMEKNLRDRFFHRLRIQRLDYDDPAGRALFKQLQLKHLPVWLFEPAVQQHPKYDTIKRWMVPAGRYRRLRIPVPFDPTAEICDNKLDDTGNGKVDCADPTCAAKRICRDKVPNKLEVFVMSRCPFAAKALGALEQVMKKHGGLIDFDIHYIADETADGEFRCLHGEPERDENIRQLCAKKLYRKDNRYLDYVYCRARDYRSSDWQRCARGGISADKIQACVRREGDKLMSRDIKLAKQLWVSGSPTWLVNNLYTFNGVTVEKIKEGFCAHNDCGARVGGSRPVGGPR